MLTVVMKRFCKSACVPLSKSRVSNSSSFIFVAEKSRIFDVVASRACTLSCKSRNMVEYHIIELVHSSFLAYDLSMAPIFARQMTSSTQSFAREIELLMMERALRRASKTVRLLKDKSKALSSAQGSNAWPNRPILRQVEKFETIALTREADAESAKAGLWRCVQIRTLPKYCTTLTSLSLPSDWARIFLSVRRYTTRSLRCRWAGMISCVVLSWSGCTLVVVRGYSDWTG